jgi:hypothetical protein
LNGPNWKYIDRNDESIVPNRWNFNNPNVNPCLSEWFGITCNSACVSTTPSTVICTVEKLILDAQHLNGTLPETIANLTNLVELSIAENLIVGQIHRDCHIKQSDSLRSE